MARLDLTTGWRRLCEEEQRLQLAYAVAVEAADGEREREDDGQEALSAWRSHQAQMRAYLRQHASHIDWNVA